MNKRIAVSLLIAASPMGLAAGTISDLQKRLETFPAKAPFAASAKVQVNAAAQEDASRAGEGAFDIESGPAGFTIRISPETLLASANEAAAQKQNPNVPTPTRTAMVALTVFDIMDSVDAASMLLDDLSGATLIDEQKGVVRVRVKPSFATKSRFVSEPKIELKIWIGSDGIPIAAERVSKYSAGIGFVRGENTRTERWDFATFGDRLYATRNEQNEDATAAGKHIKSSRIVTYVRK
ncbi:MAG TPA: hypothetical protein VL284_16865 [Thermoanaerobaculia bacterium]|nr:hypothetical protein [Thermoanaerobaculia bacterium]